MSSQLPQAAVNPPAAVPVAAPPALQPINLRLNKMILDRLDQLPGRPRAAGFHPSELHRLCPVYHYFVEDARAKLAVEPGLSMAFLRAAVNSKASEFPGRLQLEFELGDAIHQQVQFHLGVNGVLWGLWMCPHCETKVGPGFMPRALLDGRRGSPVVDGAPCVSCHGRNRRSKWSWLYLEPAAESAEWGIKGRCDGELRVARGDVLYRCALEIKSINEYGWGEGKKKAWEDYALADGWTPPPTWRPEPAAQPLPKVEHVTQASTYGWLLEMEMIYFIYVNKNQVSKWKEIMVPVDRGHLHDVTRKMTAANLAGQLQRPPLESRMCPDIREDTARACPAVEKCFGCRPAVNFWDS